MQSIPERYYKHGSSLALYKSIPEHQIYWRNHWSKANLEKLYATSRSGQLGEFEYPFSKYLPTGGTILEAGCGNGKYVCALRSRGYDVEGIDYSIDTIQRIQDTEPDLNVRVGDIFAIDRTQDFYAAYISIGVLEHHFTGLEDGLSEAYRVLKPGGVAIISVPYLNWPRRRKWRKAKEMQNDTLDNGMRFYQDHLHIESFTNQITFVGFKIIELYPYLLFGGFIRDWEIGRWLYKNHFFSWRFGQLIKRLCRNAPYWLRKDLSHMMMFICKKS